ncbi:MAG: heme exporter protein CcmB, partial [Chloroflexi bacterium]|nr:heme exporter protein CcmB [Chloroflexota bacterium]
REVMLPLLFFPVVLPAIVAAVEASGIVIRVEGGSNLTQWLSLLAVFDIIFLVVCPVAFNVILEE